MMQTILIALIPLAFIAWRLRHLIGVLRGEGAPWKKYAFAGVLALGIIARGARYLRAGGDEMSPADSAQVAWSAKAMELLSEGEDALTRCDTATANYAFQRIAGIGVDMMNADTTDGEPLYVQGIALAGLRDTANAKVLFAEGARLDRAGKMPEDHEHDEMLSRIGTLAHKSCTAAAAN